jgi:hypothetical protein
VFIEGVVKLEPVPSTVELELEAYQFNVPELAVADNNTVPAPQRFPGVVLVIVGFFEILPVNTFVVL